MRISEVAARSGIVATTLRHYETVGLLDAPRGANGYRSYDDSVLERLSFVESAKHLGLSLLEIVDLLAAVEGQTCTRSARRCTRSCVTGWPRSTGSWPG